MEFHFNEDEQKYEEFSDLIKEKTPSFLIADEESTYFSSYPYISDILRTKMRPYGNDSIDEWMKRMKKEFDLLFASGDYESYEEIPEYIRFLKIKERYRRIKKTLESPLTEKICFFFFKRGFSSYYEYDSQREFFEVANRVLSLFAFLNSLVKEDSSLFFENRRGYEEISFLAYQYGSMTAKQYILSSDCKIMHENELDEIWKQLQIFYQFKTDLFLPIMFLAVDKLLDFYEILKD